jgi:hypothetical protein
MKKTTILLTLLSLALTCPDEDEYCAFCSGEGNTQCLLCYDSYPIDGQCVTSKIKDPKCVMYSKEGHCHVCMKGFYSFEGKCLPNPIKNCLVFDPQTGKCHVCYDNRMPTNNSCSGDHKIPCFLSKFQMLFLFYGCLLCIIYVQYMEHYLSLIYFKNNL